MSDWNLYEVTNFDIKDRHTYQRIISKIPPWNKNWRLLCKNVCKKNVLTHICVFVVVPDCDYVSRLNPFKKDTIILKVGTSLSDILIKNTALISVEVIH